MAIKLNATISDWVFNDILERGRGEKGRSEYVEELIIKGYMAQNVPTDNDSFANVLHKFRETNIVYDKLEKGLSSKSQTKMLKKQEENQITANGPIA